jgi:hypothetical protein
MTASACDHHVEPTESSKAPVLFLSASARTCSQSDASGKLAYAVIDDLISIYRVYRDTKHIQ